MGSTWLLMLLGTILASVASAREPSSFWSGLKLPGSGELRGAFPKEPHAHNGTKWALLIAGSAGYGNYRHQADVCHAYQLLLKDGLKEENIVVFMYDDIANNEENPRPGTIINHPQGGDVYKGVPKDYTGSAVNVKNFLAALLGDSSAVAGGSGKVVASGPEDHVFVFYSDHGAPGILGMPEPPFLMGVDIIATLRRKRARGGFKELTFYLEACEAGSIFQGMLPEGVNVYAATAANAEENSWATYCPGMDPSPPLEYETCLGDLFSVSWMEDSDTHNLHRETLLQQFEAVRERTSNHHTYFMGSHVVAYGDLGIQGEEVAEYLGSDPANDDVPPGTASVLGRAQAWLLRLAQGLGLRERGPSEGHAVGHVRQRDADMLYLWTKARRARGSPREEEALWGLKQEAEARKLSDEALEEFGQALQVLAPPTVSLLLRRPGGAPFVDDWDCLRRSIRAYESVCGPISLYGLRHSPIFASLCNSMAGMQPSAAVEIVRSAARDTCGREGTPFEGPFSV